MVSGSRVWKTWKEANPFFSPMRARKEEEVAKGRSKAASQLTEETQNPKDLRLDYTFIWIHMPIWDFYSGRGNAWIFDLFSSPFSALMHKVSTITVSLQWQPARVFPHTSACSLTTIWVAVTLFKCLPNQAGIWRSICVSLICSASARYWKQCTKINCVKSKKKNLHHRK